MSWGFGTLFLLLQPISVRVRSFLNTPVVLLLAGFESILQLLFQTSPSWLPQKGAEKSLQVAFYRRTLLFPRTLRSERD